MITHILVPVDGSEQARVALEHALAEHPDATVTGLSVINPLETARTTEMGALSYAEEWYERAEARAESVLDNARETAAEYDIPFETAIEIGRPSREIVRYAEEGEFDAVVIGSHGRTGVSRILLGSVAEAVVRRSPVPVTVVR